MTTEDTRPVAAIVFGTRSRKEYRHIGTLAESVRKFGLLHPVVINTRDELIAGGRRLRAVEQLGWERVPVRVVACLDDALAALNAERDENTCREILSHSEKAELGRRIEELEKPAAKLRQREHGGTAPGKGRNTGGNLPQVTDAGKTRDKVAKTLGVSGRTYEKAKQVVEAAEQDPEGCGDLPAAMDAGSVDAAHKELKRRRGPRKAKAVGPAADTTESPVEPNAVVTTPPPAPVVKPQDDGRVEAVKEAVAELVAWQKRFGHLPGFAAVFAAIDRVRMSL